MPNHAGHFSCIQPTMPCWKNTTLTMMIVPSAIHCQPRKKIQVASLMTWNRIAPSTGPHSVPLPPKSDMATMKMPKVMVGKATSSGSMKPIMLPNSAPEMPRKKAEIDQATVLWRRVWRPMASALSSSSRMALTASPKRVV